jgi:L-asparaginase II
MKQNQRNGVKQAGISLLRNGVVEAVHPMRWCTSETHSPPSEWDDAPVYARSSLKPLQMAVLRMALQQQQPERLASIPTEAWAVGMASHSGEAQHQHWVQWWLTASGLPLEALCCGSHAPLCGGVSAGVLCHNCSGKHAAIVACSRWLGWPTEGYIRPEHPYFHALVHYLDGMLPHNTPLHWGVDGCTLPTPALPLRQWQQVFQAFMATPEGQQCLSMMRLYPHLISGLEASGKPRFDLALMQDAPHLVSKAGAMGFLTVWNLERHQVYVLKCESGSTHYRDAYAWWHLSQLGWVDAFTAQPHVFKVDSSPYATHPNDVVYA